MKITEITPYMVKFGRTHAFVKVETDEGLVGWGEAGTSWREKAVEGAVLHFRERLLGRNPLEIGALWQEMYRSAYFEGGRVLTGAMSAIDIALYDIAGKYLGVPVYQLLGGRQRDYVPGFATTRLQPLEQLEENLQLLLDDGWQCIRTSMASRPPESPLEPARDDEEIFEPVESIGITAEHLAHAREIVGADVLLGIDYHHRLTVAETASFCHRMPRGTLDFLEEPIRDESPEAYESLRTMIDVPLAIGEEFSSKWQFLPYIERGLTNYARIDVCNVGGLTEAVKVAGWCEAHYIDLMPHNPLSPICTAASVQLAAAVPNFSYQEMRTSPVESWYDFGEAFPVRPKQEGPRYVVPDTPGLGLEVNEDVIVEAERRFELTRGRALRRRDGSLTNW